MREYQLSPERADEARIRHLERVAQAARRRGDRAAFLILSGRLSAAYLERAAMVAELERERPA